ncbi:MAG: hypothetical protein ACM3KM_01435 [Acidobacteriaceae bacterium]
MDEQDQSEFYKQQYEDIRQRERLEAADTKQNGEAEAETGTDEEMEEGSFGGGPGQKLDFLKNKQRLEAVKEKAKEKAKQEVEKKLEKAAVKQVAEKSLMSVVWPFIAAILPWVVGFFAIILLIVILFSYIIQQCNREGLIGTAARTGSKIANMIGFSQDICKIFKIGGSNAGSMSSTEYTGSRSVAQIEAELVPITGVPVDPNLPAWRAMVRSCMLRKIQQLYALSQQQGISWVVTSGYRPESTGSYHQSGEAADLALRNPTPVQNMGIRPPNYIIPGSVPPTGDPRIAQLAALARQVFLNPQADVIDEYNQPSSKTEGGHIHVEYNLNRATDPPQSYCDTAP